MIWNEHSSFFISQSSPQLAHSNQNLSKSPDFRKTPPSSSTIDRRKRYVLVVEDNKFAMTWIIGMLKQLKMEPIFAENGKEAVDIFQ